MNAPVKVVASSQWPSDHLAGGPCGGDVYVYTYASLGQRLDVPFGAHELEIFVDDGSLELGRAGFVVPAQVPKLQLLEATYAGRYGGFRIPSARANDSRSEISDSPGWKRR